MIFANTLYFGVDPASGNKDFSYAVLDGNLNLIELNDADMDEMLALLGKQSSAVVAFNAPAGVNRGLVKKKLERESESEGRAFRGVDIRLAEYELRKRGISVAGTPSREEYCPAWVQVGLRLYGELPKLGFSLSQTEGAKLQFLETHPYACFCVMLGGIPLSRPTLEGRLQRQLLLNDKGMRINDAMDFFEEITRFRLMKGILPTEMLYTPEQLDVLVSAYTAWLMTNHPGEVTRVGDKSEGQVIVPGKDLLAKYG